MRTYAIVLLGSALLLTGCSRHFDNAQTNQALQKKIQADARLASSSVRGMASGGRVTLSGTANNAIERSAAVEDALQVDGIKIVVDNIQILAPEVKGVSHL